MNNQDRSEKCPQLEEIISLIRDEIRLQQRPPNEVILDDPGLQKLMHVSKRKTQQWRDEGQLTYYKPSGKIFYLLSDVLAMLEIAKVPSNEDYLSNLLLSKKAKKTK